MADRSEGLADSKGPDVILRGVRTMAVDASRASLFGNDQMKAALGKNKGFAVKRLKPYRVETPATKKK